MNDNPRARDAIPYSFVAQANAGHQQSFTKSIAILPFVNRSNDPDNEYFSDGITEDIINALASVQGLRVMARTSSFAFKGKNVDVRTIGQILGVSTVLEGSVRKVKQRVRISARLIDAVEGTHLWSKNFDRELADIFEVQDEVSLLIADQIRENFGHFDLADHLISKPTQNINAYNLYLKARYHQLKWNYKDLRYACELYEQSTQADPQFALPFFGAGLCYGINASWGFFPYEEGIAKARSFLTAGLELDQGSYLSYFARATVSFWGEWNFEQGETYLRKAVALNPSFSDAEEGLTELLTALGRFDEAHEHARNILMLNPLSPNHYYTQANIYYLSGQFEQAVMTARQALKIDPGFALALELIALSFIHLKDYAQLDQFLQTHTQLERPAACRALYQLVHPDEAVQVDMEAIRLQLRDGMGATLIAWELYLHVYLGNHEVALDMLEAGVGRRSGQMINFQKDPLLYPLHEQSRFQRLVKVVFAETSADADQLLEEAVAIEVKKKVLSPPQVQHYQQAAEALMQNEQVFLDPNLSLKSLAQQLQLHPNKLSWLINEQMGCNFNEYVNRYRLKAFKERALEPKNAHLTLLGLAYESGFNSKTVFNAFFKKMEGTTPRNWLKQQAS